MAGVEEAHAKAFSYLEAAEQAEQVVKLTKNPKLMIPMLENLFLSMSNVMTALLAHCRQNIPESFDAKFALFRQSCSGKMKVDPRHLKVMLEMKEIIVLHNLSPMEFQRGSSYVICADDYNMKILSPERLRQYTSNAKAFLVFMEKVVNERIIV